MNKQHLFILLMTAIILAACKSPHPQNPQPAIIPLPTALKLQQGEFILNKNTKITIPDREDARQVANYFTDFLSIPTGFSLQISTKKTANNNIVFQWVQTDSLGSEGYLLDVNSEVITISANGRAGWFYGVQTLLQLLPPEIFSRQKVANTDWTIPAVSIYDKPRFAWRGMHLDVSRHFFPIDFIKTYIDLIAMHKMNVFHWHLTDDNGWRIEIKKYPKLTEVSAWRADRENQPWNEATDPKPGEQATYGGFYTQDEIREVVAYAAEQQVTIVPEIEMPGHSSEVFAAYPSLSCKGEKTFVRPGGYWPNEDIFCAGNDSVFVFLEDVLDEVMDLFPGATIHIGGDEANKAHWKTCPKCQCRMRDEHLKTVEELQSWFVRRIEQYLVAHNKKLLGWDEILEGGLAPEATVMSWRGMKGGIESAKQGHSVVMTPGSHCYFDHYQADPEFEPNAIGGFTTLKKVYAFEPVPDELSTEQARFILGAQGNVWTEYIPTPEHAEYMAVPRMTALAEVVWSPASSRNWEDFRKRINIQYQRFDAMGVNYSKGSWRVDIQAEMLADGKQFRITLETEQPGFPVYYTLDGSEPDTTSLLCSGPFGIQKSTTLKAAILENGKRKERGSEKSFLFHKALGKPVMLNNPPNKKYRGNGAFSLVDGMSGSSKYNDGYWLGFKGDDVDVFIDLNEAMSVNEVKVRCYQRQASWIFLPMEVRINLLDKKQQVIASKTLRPKAKPDAEGVVIENFDADFRDTRAQYVRVLGLNRGVCPQWHRGAGQQSWIFVDEVVVD